MNVTARRGLGDKPGDEIVDDLLVVEGAGLARGAAEINFHCSDRIILKGSGPKNDFMAPGDLVEIVDKEHSYRGIVKMYGRQYNLDEDKFTITTNMEIEVQAEDIKPR